MRTKFPLYQAHRGAGKLAPENTLEAFKVGFEKGFRAAECDVKLSQDKELILLHDDTLLRTGGMDVKAQDVKASELTQCSVSLGHPGFEGSCVPLLKDVLDFCSQNNMAINLEIKSNPGEERETGIACANMVYELLKNHPLTFMFSSFDIESLEGIREAYPEAPIALLVEDEMVDEKVLKQLKDLKAFALNLDLKLITKERVKLLIDNGYDVNVWTVNDTEKAEELLSWGVASIITDDFRTAKLAE